MKKLLALVLALVMSMSLVTISNAAYSDKADIDLKEAVDVLSAVGVFEGSDGKFDPKADLTREQAAKLVAYLQLGQKSADALVGGNKFTDVAANRWSAGYVDYCATTGVVAGVGNGQFNPTGSLTALQFGKMLLVCLGYDATTENLTGADWQINTSKLMASAKLLKGLDSVKANDVITREQAAQMMLNAIKAPTVEYDTKGSTITIGGTVIGIGGSKATYVTATVAEDKSVTNIGKTQLTNSTAYTVELGEKLFSNLKLSSDTDAFVRPVTVWTLKAEKIGSYANTPDLTYTAEVKLGTIYSDLGTSKKLVYSSTALVANDTDKFAYYADGTINASLSSDIAKGNDQKVGGNGVLIEVYYDDVANTAKVVEINTYGGEVTSARAKTASKDANVTVTPLNAGKGGNYETEDFKVDDIVAYNYSTKTGDAGVKNVVTAEKVTGELTGYTAGKSVVVGGTTYKFNKAASIDVSALAGAIDNDVTLALDKYGYVLNVNTDATSTNYAVVLKYKDKGTFDDAKAELLFTDGTTKTVELKDNVDKKGATAGTNVEYGAIVSYTITNKGKYDLKVLENATTAQNVTLTAKGSSAIEIGSVRTANGKTIFLVATKSGNSDTVYTSYTGIANVPTIKVDNTAAATVNAYVKSGSAATVVYIDATGANANVVSSTKNVVFVKGSGTIGASYDTKKGTFFTYDAIVNGEITTIDSAAKIDSYKMYTVMATDANGVVSLSGDAEANGVFSGTGTDKAANDAIGLAGKYYSYSKDCQVFYIDSDGTISTSSIGGISKDETDGVWFKVTDGDVTTIVIKEAVSASNSYTVTAVNANGIALGSAQNVVAGTGDKTATITDSVVANNSKTVALKISNVAAGTSVQVTPDVQTLKTTQNSYVFTVTATAENGNVSTCTVTVNLTVS